jgi:hypothetical protein
MHIMTISASTVANTHKHTSTHQQNHTRRSLMAHIKSHLLPGGSRHQNLRMQSWEAVPTMCPAGCQAITSTDWRCASAIMLCGICKRAWYSTYVI